MWLLNRALIAVFLLYIPLSVEAGIESHSPWQLGGFVTQGWTISDRNDFFGRSSDSNGSFSFRELGFNANYQVNNQISVSSQVISRWAGEVDRGDTTVDYLLADWSAIQRENIQAGVRIGRIKNPIGFFNDTRDVAFTRPSALLPQSIYQTRIRELLLSSDGVALYLNKDFEHSHVSTTLLSGKPQVGANSEPPLLGRNWDGKFDNADINLFNVVYEQDSGLRLGFTYVDANSDFLGLGADPFTNGSIDIKVTGYSIQFNQQNFSITAEYALQKIKRLDFNNFYNGTDNTIEAFYVQFDYRVVPSWTVFIRYDELIGDRSDKDGKRFQALTGLPAHQRFAKDWTIGMGYRYSPRILLRGEFHHVNGTAWVSRIDNPDPSKLKQDWNLFLFQASYRF